MVKRVMTEAERKKRSDSAKLARAEQKLEDPEAYARRCKNTSLAMKKQWSEVDQSERVDKMTATVRETVSKMTDQERRDKYGWMNDPSVTSQRKREVWQQSLAKWWDSASEDDKAAIYKKRADAMSKAWKSLTPEQHAEWCKAIDGGRLRSPKSFKDQYEALAYFTSRGWKPPFTDEDLMELFQCQP